jgi:hypothetical protein
MDLGFRVRKENPQGFRVEGKKEKPTWAGKPRWI